MIELRRTLRLRDGLAVVIGIMIGSGIFRTPSIVAAELGRSWLTFVAWVLGGVVALAGAVIFAELATRHPRAGGKYVYVREAFGPRAGFVVGVLEVAIYATAIAALAALAGDYIGQLAGLATGTSHYLGALMIGLFALVNLAGVTHNKVVQNIATAAKVVALIAIVVIGLTSDPVGPPSGALVDAPTGTAIIPALAVAFQAVIWTYYGYPDAAKIAEEVVEPSRLLPRILLGSIAVTTALYLLLNAAFLHVLPLQTIASSKLVAADVAIAIFGERGGQVIAAIALVVVVASIAGNVFVTPRVVFAIARDGIGPPLLARVNRGGTPWAATLVVAGAAIALAVTGTFEQLFGVAIVLVLVIDGASALTLVRLRRREPAAPFMVPALVIVITGYLTIYGGLFVVSVVDNPVLAVAAAGVLGGACVWSIVAVPRPGTARFR